MKQFYKNIIFPIFHNSDGDFIVPYLYGFIMILLFVLTVVIFLVMAIGKFPPAILGCVGGVIGTLAGLYLIIVNQYNRAMDRKAGITTNISDADINKKHGV